MIVVGIDRLLRRVYDVHAFSEKNADILRISFSIANAPLSLPDGTVIRRGDRMIDLHIWNERLPTLGNLGPGLGWGSRARHRIGRSLAALAWHLETTATIDDWAAIRGRVVILDGRKGVKLEQIAARFGLITNEEIRRADLGHGLLALAFAWAFNPGSLGGKPFCPSRHELWMSRAAFCARYLEDSPRKATNLSETKVIWPPPMVLTPGPTSPNCSEQGWSPLNAPCADGSCHLDRAPVSAAKAGL